jgi:hypothetical protein
MTMEMMRHRVTLLVHVVTIIGICAVGSTVFGQSPADGAKIKSRDHAPGVVTADVTASVNGTAAVFAFALQADKAPYDGAYQGSYSGAFAGQPATGSVAFSVTKNVITVTDPGQGAGTVDSSGSATFSGSLGVQNVMCRFVGAFRSSTSAQHGVQASGAWTCTGSGQTGKGMWSADRH